MLVNVNVGLGHWPFQRFAQRSSAAMARHLAREGMAEAWVSCIDSVLFPDPDETDELLFGRLAGHRLFRFVKTVNPVLGNWRESLAHWVEARGVRVMRVLPNYHQYALSDTLGTAVAEQAVRHRMPLVVPMRLEDERSHYPLMQVPAVPVADILHLANAFPKLRILVLCAYYHETLELTRGASNVWVDFAFSEPVGTVRTMLDHMPATRLCFGSHTPFLCTRAAWMKLESAGLPKRAWAQVAHGNAGALLRK